MNFTTESQRSTQIPVWYQGLNIVTEITWIELRIIQ